MSSTRTFLLGAFFLLALGVLGYYTLFLTNFDPFGEQPEITLHFAETNGLREGDAVLVAGIRWGRVKSIELQMDEPRDRRARVEVVLQKPLPLRSDFLIEIQDATFLGGKQVVIEPGTSDEPAPPDALLVGTVATSALDAVGQLVSESQKGIAQIVDDLAAVTRSAREGDGPFQRVLNDREMAENVAATAESAARAAQAAAAIGEDLVQGRGTAGKLLTETELYEGLLAAVQDLGQAASQMVQVTGRFERGGGILPMLFEDEELADELASAVRRFNSIATKIDRGDGTVGALVNDPQIADNLRTISGGIARGEGSLGKLLTTSELHDNLVAISEDVAYLTSLARSGQGTIGRLMTDDEVYQQIKVALSILTRALEEYREAAPITTFTAVLFAAF